MLTEVFLRVSHPGGEEVVMLCKPLDMVPNSRSLTSAMYRARESLLVVPVRQVTRRCEHCPAGDGILLVLRLRDPAL